MDRNKTLRDAKIALGEVKKSKKNAYKCFAYLLSRLKLLGHSPPFVSDDWIQYIEWSKMTTIRLLKENENA